jgi:hypothetical protein
MKRIAYWLMANMVYYNGSRPQAATLMKNSDFCRWQKATVDGIGSPAGSLKKAE